MIVPVSINASKIDVLAYARSVNKEDAFFEALAKVFSVDEDDWYSVADVRSMFIINDNGREPPFSHIFFDSKGIMDGADLGTIQKWDMQTKTITGQEMFEIIMGKVKPTIHEAAFLTKSVGLNEIQALIDVCHKHGKTFWGSAEYFMRFILNHEDKHVTFFSDECGLNGDSAGLTGNQVLVSYDEFLRLLEMHYEDQKEKINLIPDGYTPYLEGTLMPAWKEVEVILRDGQNLKGRVSKFNWLQSGSGGDVVAYRFLDEEPVPVKSPRPRYRKRNRQKPTVAKTIVRVLYTTQQVYTFKNVRSVQIIDDKVYIQYERDITEGIKESSESEINSDLVMAVVIHEVGNRSNFFRNIDGTWDFQAEDGTVINSGKQLGRVFKK